MLKVEGLKDRLLTANKKPYPTEESCYGYLYVEALGQMNNFSGKEKIEGNVLGERFLTASDEIELDKSEVETLKKAIDAMKIGGEKLRGHVYVQLLSKIKETTE